MHLLTIHSIQTRIVNSGVFRFALVGGAGFIIDSLIFLTCFYGLNIPLYTSRAIAFFCAVLTTWLGNRIYTFRSNEEKRFRQWLSFFICALFSAIPNFIVFSAITTIADSTGITPYAAMVCGILTGMVSNYLLCKTWVFSSG